MGCPFLLAAAADIRCTPEIPVSTQRVRVPTPRIWGKLPLRQAGSRKKAAEATQPAKIMLSFITNHPRHSGESRNPRWQCRDIFTHPVSHPWIPAFAGMTGKGNAKVSLA
jgi:hypothetical protein